MDDLVLKLRILAKAELLLFRLQLRRTLRQAALGLIAVLLVVLAVGMLNVALYQYLAAPLGSAGAALVVALLDLAIAGLVLVAAGRQQLGEEYETAHDLSEKVMADLNADILRLRAQAADLQDDIKQLRMAASGFLNPGGFSLPTILQWISMVFRFFRK